MNNFQFIRLRRMLRSMSSTSSFVDDIYQKNQMSQALILPQYPGDFSLAGHTHNYASSSHTHDYAASSHTHNYASASHTHSTYATKTYVDNAVAGIDIGTVPSHTHDYAATSHTHSYASTSHTHSTYAAKSHTHKGEDLTSRVYTTTFTVRSTTTYPYSKKLTVDKNVKCIHFNLQNVTLASSSADCQGIDTLSFISSLDWAFSSDVGTTYQATPVDNSSESKYLCQLKAKLDSSDYSITFEIPAAADIKTTTFSIVVW